MQLASEPPPGPASVRHTEEVLAVLFDAEVGQTAAAKGAGQLRSVLTTDADLGLNLINPSDQADF
jgi:hypothetical protein